MDELTRILEDLRQLIAKGNDEKDNVLLDVLDSLSLAIFTIIKTNIDLSTKIENKQTGTNIITDLTKVESILKVSFDNLTKINETQITTTTVIFDKLVGILNLITKNSTKEELIAINKTLSSISYKEDLTSIAKALDRKDEQWKFDVQVDSKGNISSVNAKRIK